MSTIVEMDERYPSPLIVKKKKKGLHFRWGAIDRRAARNETTGWRIATEEEAYCPYLKFRDGRYQYGDNVLLCIDDESANAIRQRKNYMAEAEIKKINRNVDGIKKTLTAKKEII